ncbi:hypothetical protein [Sphingomonas turrisvirgatae]|nr:hypothetical protein [Sphingomonas turrisvirgatae]
MHLGREPILHRLADLVTVATAVMVRHRLSTVRRNLIAVAIGMAEARRNV